MDAFRRFAPIFAVALLCMAAITAIRPIAAAPSSPTGLVIPLYTYPTDVTWNTVLNAKNAHPTVPFIAVINPNSGPGSALDANYVSGIKAFQAAGIMVLGYIATGYGSNLLTTVESQALAYKNWYGVDGIMFDEMGNSIGQEAYYSALNLYVKSLGMTFTMGNPGTLVPNTFIGTLDALDIYENAGYPTISTLSQYSAYPKTGFAMIAFGVPLNLSFIAAASPYVSWLWLTNDSGGNPYDSLPPYFSAEVAALDASVLIASTTTMTQTATVTQTATATQTVTTTATTTAVSTVSVTTTAESSSSPQSFTIKAVNQFGSPLSGFWLILYDQFNMTIATGFTPSSWTLNPGSYMVQVDGYGTCNPNHWSDGGPSSQARSKLHAFTIGMIAVSLTAVYNC